MDVDVHVSSSSDTAAAASSGGTSSEPTAAAAVTTDVSVVQGDTFFGGGAMTTYRALRAGLETARVWNQLCRHQPLFPGQSNITAHIHFAF